MISLSNRLLGVALCVAALGCGDDGNDMGPRDLSAEVVLPAHNFQQINDNILQPSCANFTVCHSPEGKTMAKLVMKGTADMAYAALINVAAQNDQAKIEGLVEVKPCDPDHSFLLTKLNLPVSATDPKVGYGEHMPKDNPALPQEQLDSLRAWIARGALRDEPTSVTGSTCMLNPDLGMKD
jgi:hypothetical protein